MGKKKQVGWSVPEELHRSIKLEAALQRRTMAAILEDAIREYLARRHRCQN